MSDFVICPYADDCQHKDKLLCLPPGGRQRGLNVNAYHKLAQEKQAELNRLLVERTTEYGGEFPPDLKPMLEEIGTLLALGNYADMLERLHAIVKDQAWYKPVIGDSVVTSVENIIAAFRRRLQG